jgi:[ribosomal protein S18]-alanine N-acetyltransferase
VDTLAKQAFAAIAGEALEAQIMTKESIEQIMPIELKAYPHPWTARNFADCLDAGYDAVLLKGRQSGIVYAYSVCMNVVDEVHLLNITVAPDYQKKGLGRAYLLTLLEKATADSASGLLLEVRVSNVAALSLYTSIGFIQLGRRVGYYPSKNDSREDALVMFHSLAHE